MAKHTPGPWRLSLKRTDSGRPYARIVAGNGYLDRHGHGFEVTGILSPADARLIAAAPRLLEALRSALENTDEGFDHAPWRDEARAAIAEAGG